MQIDSKRLGFSKLLCCCGSFLLKMQGVGMRLRGTHAAVCCSVCVEKMATVNQVILTRGCQVCSFV